MYINTKPKRSGFKWTDKELKILQRLLELKKTPKQCAQRLQRSVTAIELQIQKLRRKQHTAMPVPKKLPPPRREKQRVLEIRGRAAQGVLKPILLPHVSILEGEEGYTTIEY